MIPTLTERVPGKLYILMVEDPGPDSQFVEVEDSDGNSINLGPWAKLPCGLFALEINDPRG